MKSKVICFTILFLFSLILITSGQFTEKGSWKQLKVAGCSIYYPDEMIVDTSGRMGTLFVLKTPLEDSADQFLENFNLLEPQEVYLSLSIEDYGRESVRNIINMLDSVKIIWQDTITISGDSIYKVVYDFQMGKFPLRALQYYYKKKEHYYILTFTAEQKAYEKFEELALKLMSTLKIISN